MTFFLNDKVRKSEIILTKFPFRDSIQSTFIYPGKILSPQPRLSLILLSLGGGTNFKGAIPNIIFYVFLSTVQLSCPLKNL